MRWKLTSAGCGSTPNLAMAHGAGPKPAAPHAPASCCALLCSKRPSAGSVRGRRERRRRRKSTQAFIAASRTAATRRRNVLTGGLAAGLVLALGLAAWAWRERGIAIDQKSLAQRNFDAAKSTIDFVVLDIAQGLKDVEGMRAETVRRILGRAEKAVDTLASETGNDPEVRQSQGEMYGLFSENYSRVGATDLAVSYAQKGIDIDRSLITNQPDNVTSQIDLAAALGGLGDALVTKGTTRVRWPRFRRLTPLRAQA